MHNHISLGCNCHPAYWLRKKNLQEKSMPFDWLLADPADFLNCVRILIKSEFKNWLLEIKTHENGHCVDINFPNVFLFHHKKLISDNSNEVLIEKQRLIRRANRFLEAIKNNENNFYIYYPINKYDSHQRFCDELHKVSLLINGRIIIYYVSDKLENSKYITANDKELYLKCVKNLLKTDINNKNYFYWRNKQIHNIWGQEPDFF